MRELAGFALTELEARRNEERSHKAKQALAADLAESAAQLASAVAAARLGTFDWNLATDAVQLNERAREFYAFALEQELTARDVFDLMDPAERESVQATCTAAISTGTRIERDYHVHLLDGTVRALSTVAEPVFGTDGKPMRYVGGIRDVTAEREVLTAARENEARFRQLADSMPQIVWAARPDGTVDYYNQRWYDYTGMSKGGTGDASWDTTITAEDARLLHETWYGSVRTGQVFEVEFRLRRASDGALRWQLGRGMPVRDESGRIVRWFGTNTDIHEYKELQQQNAQLLESERAARAEAERISHVKDEFLATLSHELRTPLNAILG